MKKIYLFAAMAALLASCSSDNLPQEQTAVKQNAEPGAVLFDVYTQRATTRAGEVGSLNTEGFKTGNFKEEGFGVFGYYTNSSTYDQQAIPNFFYNQQVTWTTANGGYFKYEPVKYWPNEFGTSANSDDADKVTYFAYAPWVSVNPATGKPDGKPSTSLTADQLSDLQKWGISSMTTNSTTGDPLIKYVASFDQEKSVDLCWGVCDEINWQKIQDGASQTFDLGKPWINVERPANTNQKLKFTFKHATAQLKVNIDAFVDGITNANEIAAGTKVYVRAITFEGLATKGSLNLNNTETGANKAYWMDYNGVNDLPMGETVTIYDGRKDGKEGTPSGEATNEKSLGLNPNLVQSTLWTPATGDPAPMPGVTKVSQPLFCNGNAPATEPIYVIPTGDPVKITITYDIETADDNLSTYVSDAEQHGSSIENVIWKNITFGKDELGNVLNKFENGKSYTINLHLGMNSVKFDAAVTDWVAQAANDVDLPANIPSYEPTSSGTTVTAELAYDLTSYQFAITGLEPFEEITKPSTIAPVTSIAPATIKANASGVAIVTLGLSANNLVMDRTTATPIAFSTSAGDLNVIVTQKAAPLKLNVDVANITANKIPLTSVNIADGYVWNSADRGVDKDNLSTNGNIKIIKNGIPLGYGSDFSFNLGTITLITDDITPNDVYSITVKAGDAAAETYVLKIASSPSFVPDADEITASATESKEWTLPEAVGTGLLYSYTKDTDDDNAVSSFDNRVATVALYATGSDKTVIFKATASAAPGYVLCPGEPTFATFTLTVKAAE